MTYATIRSCTQAMLVSSNWQIFAYQIFSVIQNRYVILSLEGTCLVNAIPVKEQDSPTFYQDVITAESGKNEK